VTTVCQSGEKSDAVKQEGRSMSDISDSTEERIIQVLQHLGIKQAHFAARVMEDCTGLAARYPEVILSLAVICPNNLDPRHLGDLSSRLLVFSGDQPPEGSRVIKALKRLPEAKQVVFTDYPTFLWTDILLERGTEIGAALIEFGRSAGHSQKSQSLASGGERGEVAGVSYQVLGTFYRWHWLLRDGIRCSPD
jgi:hypothetical protein